MGNKGISGTTFLHKNSTSPSSNILHKSVGELFPGRKQILVVDAEESVPDAFTKIVNAGVLSAPVVHSGSKIPTSVLDTLDVLAFVSSIFEHKDLVSKHAASDFLGLLGKKDFDFCTKKVSDIVGMADRHPYAAVDSKTPLLEVLTLMGEKNAHRVYIVDDGGALQNVVSQSDVAAFLFKHAKELLDDGFGDKSVDELKIGTDEVLSCRATDRTLDAFKEMGAARVSGLPVLDTSGCLVGNLSARDLKEVKNGVFGRLNSTVHDFTTAALKSKVDLRAPAVSVEGSSTFLHLMGSICATKLHRVYVVHGQKPTKVVTLMHVLRPFLP